MGPFRGFVLMIAQERDAAIVLSGGGAYGAYEVGVLKALIAGQSATTDFHPLVPERIAGTSIGAINAAVIASKSSYGLQYAVEYLEQVWTNKFASGSSSCGNGLYRVRGGAFELSDPNCLTNPISLAGRLANDGLSFANEFFRYANQGLASNGSLTQRALELLDLSVLFDRSPFDALLPKIISMEELATSSIDLTVTTTNFETGKNEKFSADEIVNEYGFDVLRASTAIPSVFDGIVIGDDLHVDGSALVNTPLISAVHGSSELHVVYMDPDIETIPIEALQNTLGVIDRLLVTTFAYVMNQDINSIEGFNKTLDLIYENVDVDVKPTSQADALQKTANQIRKKLQASSDWSHTTIHKYHPAEDLGGAVGFLNFDIKQIRNLIDRGYRDTIEHDCERNDCVIARRK